MFLCREVITQNKKMVLIFIKAASPSEPHRVSVVVTNEQEKKCGWCQMSVCSTFRKIFHTSFQPRVQTGSLVL